jgi:hypothetical protein
MPPPWRRRFAWLPVRLTHNGFRGRLKWLVWIEERCWDAGWLAAKSYDRRLPK